MFKKKFQKTKFQKKKLSKNKISKKKLSKNKISNIFFLKNKKYIETKGQTFLF